MTLIDPQNWQLISQGDKKAFEEVFNAYYQPLCSYSCSILKNIEEAEEVVQNVFYNLWIKREQIEVSSSLKSYIYRAVHNDSLNKIKHTKVRTSYANDYKATTSVSATDSSNIMEAKELRNEIEAAIASLPEQCGIVFRLSRLENLKYQEIADQLNISVKTVEGHMGKALKILRERLKDYLPLLIWILNLSHS